MKSVLKTLSLVIILAITFVSCKKDNKNDGDSTEIEYRITPFNTFFTEVSYVNENGQTITTVNPNVDFGGGIKKISVKSKPFPASFSLKVSNPTTTTYTYVLSIYVNGELKASKSENLAPMFNNQVSKVEFLVN